MSDKFNFIDDIHVSKNLLIFITQKKKIRLWYFDVEKVKLLIERIINRGKYDAHIESFMEIYSKDKKNTNNLVFVSSAYYEYVDGNEIDRFSGRINDTITIFNSRGNVSIIDLSNFDDSDRMLIYLYYLLDNSLHNKINSRISRTNNYKNFQIQPTFDKIRDKFSPFL